MVARMLIAALFAASSVAAAAAPVADPSATGGTAVVAEARVTISRPIVLQNDAIDARMIGIQPVRQPPRRCASADSSAPDCRLIVYDLP